MAWSVETDISPTRHLTSCFNVYTTIIQKREIIMKLTYSWTKTVLNGFHNAIPWLGFTASICDSIHIDLENKKASAGDQELLQW